MYRAHDARLGRDVAIKILPAAFTADPERLARFEREARVLAALNHPHIAGDLRHRRGRRRTRARAGAGRRADARGRIAAGRMPVEEALTSAGKSPTRSRPRTTRASSTAT